MTKPAPSKQNSDPFWSANMPDSFRKDAKINWYRSKVDPKVMSELMQCSD